MHTGAVAPFQSGTKSLNKQKGKKGKSIFVERFPAFIARGNAEEVFCVRAQPSRCRSTAARQRTQDRFGIPVAADGESEAFQNVRLIEARTPVGGAFLRAHLLNLKGICILLDGMIRLFQLM